MAESETGLTDLVHDLDLEDVNDTGYKRDINVKIINGFYYQNVAYLLTIGWGCIVMTALGLSKTMLFRMHSYMECASVEPLKSLKRKWIWSEFLVASMIGLIRVVELRKQELGNLECFTSFLVLIKRC